MKNINTKVISMDDMYENMPAIMEEVRLNNLLVSFLKGECDYNKTINEFSIFLEQVKLEDIAKKEVYLNGGMGRLAMQEFDEARDLDFPLIRREINYFKGRILDSLNR